MKTQRAAPVEYLEYLDPLLLASTTEDFERSGPTRGFEAWAFPRVVATGSVKRVFLLGEFSDQAEQLGDRLTFHGHPLLVRAPRVLELSPTALMDGRTQRSLSYAGLIGRLCAMYSMPLSSPFLDELASEWIWREELPESGDRRFFGLKPLCLTEVERGYVDVAMGLCEPDDVLVSSVNEGCLICVIGLSSSVERLQSRRGIPRSTRGGAMR